MNFNKHLELKGKHALLSPSQPYWLEYSEEQLQQKFRSAYAQDIGTAMHELAETLISNRIRLKKTDISVPIIHLVRLGIPRAAFDMDFLYPNFMRYVNDAIGYRMTPEQILYYSNECFGTADAICFRDNILRIHDYKSGVTRAKMEQLLVYAALFCLEYRTDPNSLKEVELRLYQNDEVICHKPTAEDILIVSDSIKVSSNVTQQLRMEG